MKACDDGAVDQVPSLPTARVAPTSPTAGLAIWMAPCADLPAHPLRRQRRLRLRHTQPAFSPAIAVIAPPRSSQMAFVPMVGQAPKKSACACGTDYTCGRRYLDGTICRTLDTPHPPPPPQPPPSSPPTPPGPTLAAHSPTQPPPCARLPPRPAWRRHSGSAGSSVGWGRDFVRRRNAHGTFRYEHAHYH
jgi:hypothetical protein